MMVPSVNRSLPGNLRCTSECMRNALDHLGALLSGVCAVHCLVVPLAFVLIPSLTIALYAWGEPEHRIATMLLHLARFEWLAASLAAAVALASTAWGWLRHRRKSPLAGALGGGTLLLSAALSPLAQGNMLWHTLFAVAGGATLVGAHLLNLCARKRCAPVARGPGTP